MTDHLFAICTCKESPSHNDLAAPLDSIHGSEVPDENVSPSSTDGAGAAATDQASIDTRCSNARGSHPRVRSLAVERVRGDHSCAFATMRTCTPSQQGTCEPTNAHVHKTHLRTRTHARARTRARARIHIHIPVPACTRARACCACAVLCCAVLITISVLCCLS